MKVTYNTIWINEAFISNFFAITLQLLYLIFVQLPTTNYSIIIIKILVFNITNYYYFKLGNHNLT
jgi:hypothetical protein